MMLQCTLRNGCSVDCITPSSIVQPSQRCAYRQISSLLQHNPVTKTSPTNLLSDPKFLLSRFIALCPTILATLLERHHQCRTKRNAELRQQPRPQESYNRNNSTTGSKPELVHGRGACRCTAATTAVQGMVSPRLASTMLPNDIAHHRYLHSTRRTAILHYTLAPKLSQGAREFKFT